MSLDSKERKDGVETTDVGPKMKYLNLTNEERNQYTTTSITSNLALYEVSIQRVRERERGGGGRERGERYSIMYVLLSVVVVCCSKSYMIPLTFHKVYGMRGSSHFSHSLFSHTWSWPMNVIYIYSEQESVNYTCVS